MTSEADVLKQQIRPHWLADGYRFWYRHERADGAIEFLLVDPTSGEQKPAFDHERLAAALTTVTGAPVRADHLPISWIRVESQAQTLLLATADATWRFDMLTGVMVEQPYARRPPVDGASLGPTRRAGRATTLSFTNRTAGPLLTHFVDDEGRRKRSAEIASGNVYVEHTFAGAHCVVTDLEGRVYAAFETPEDGGEFVLDAAMRPIAGNGAVAEGLRSPDGRREALVKDHNVYVRTSHGGPLVPLSRDGSADDSYALEDLLWSPDSTKLLAMRVRKGDERKIHLVESSPADQTEPKLRSFDYPKPGDRIPVKKPHVFDVTTRARITVDDSLLTNPWSLTDWHWSSDSKKLTVLYNQRGHQLVRVVSVDVATGKTHALVEERSKTFIDYTGKVDYRLLDDSHEIVWMSERDGWNHLYLYDADTGLVKTQITRGSWVVRRVERVDSKRRQIWFLAGGVRGGQDPYYVDLCRVNFDGSGFTVLTEGNGTHAIVFSPDERFFVDTWSRVDQPPVTELRRASDGQLIRELGRVDARRLLESGWVAPERFVAKGRDAATEIHGIIIRPNHFDPKKKYAVIEDIYTSPKRAHVTKSFGIDANIRALAERGFIVVQIDGMGTSYRSKAFQDVAWKNLADAGFPDRIAWLKLAAATHPEIDLTRVGIYGASAGGQSAMRALLSYSDFYKVAVADSGCHDNRMDKIWWNEQWMGWPVDDSYAKSSNVVDAHKLQGRLLLMVGELDNNVDPSSTMQVVNALIKADKEFDLLVVPGAGHMVGTTPYGARRVADFFLRNLGGPN